MDADHLKPEPDAALPTPAPSSLAQDTLLVLFDPASGTVRGEGMPLSVVLAGAALVDLAFDDHITLDQRGLLRGDEVRVISDVPPAEPVLRDVWERLATGPMEVHGRVAQIGPRLRAPLLDALVRDGHLRRERRRLLGVFPATVLVDGKTGHRSRLVAAVRDVLVNGAEPDRRTAGLVALLSASGTLAQFDKEIGWSSTIAMRAQRFRKGEWGTVVAAEAATRIAASLVASSLFTSVIASRDD
ncbi:GOLPH3/VPS74 family protein [Tomitella gaofuii]|uniref:GOLPH3/VPS74 family protein n=1 Tax=Tomitella gaofuii TaxID=2760083 RepID=UPI0015FB138F|nr:GPP34 family phosphoprotein [Tomitella gaofuii]